MIVFLVAFTCVIWTSVSLLCISYFNDSAAGWDEWESFPRMFRLLVVAISPIGFIWWWFR